MVLYSEEVVPRLSNRALALVSDVESSLSRWTSDESALEEVVEPLRVLLGAEKSAAYTFATERGVSCVGHAVQSRIPGMARFVEDSRSFPSGWATYDASCPEPPQRDRALRIRELRAMTGRVGSLLGSAYWNRIGLGDRDQLRVLVCDGPVALAWVGAFRPGEFSIEDRRLLQRVVPALKKRLRLEARLRDGDLARATMSAALDRLGSPAFVVSKRGKVEHTNAAGRAVMSEDAAGVVASIQREIAGRTDAVTPIHVNGEGTHYLVMLRATAAAARASSASAVWELSSRQRQIVTALADGASNRVIAARLGISVRTVEVHLTKIYERAGVAGRGELLARVLEHTT